MDTTTAPESAARRAVTLLGGPVRTARTLDVKGHRHQTVQGWLRDGVPAKYCPLIERATAGAVRCEDLRPDIAWCVLRQPPELIGAEGAPAPQPAELRDAA